MDDCKWTKMCVFGNDANDSVHAVIRNFFRNEYCKKNYAECARFMVYNRLGENVPAELLPNQPDKAIGIIKQS